MTINRALLQVVRNEPSYCIDAGGTQVCVTRMGGMMAPVTFFGDSEAPVQPYYIAPWWDEGVTPDTPSLLATLRGDFFCAPFGGNEEPYQGHMDPPHGEPANAPWRLGSFEEGKAGVALELTQTQTIRPGTIRKRLAIRSDQSVVYTQHLLEGMDGPMCVGHHANHYIPDQNGPAFVSFARHRYAHTYVQPTERPEGRGYSMLQPDTPIEDLTRCPTVDGGFTDLTRWPARRGYEDIAIICADADLELGWTALSVPKAGYVWFFLKDPAVLVSSLMWMSNGGRHFPPWNGRNLNCLGLEEITGFFHEGLACSAKKNFLSDMGVPTCHQLTPNNPLPINAIQGVVRISPDFKGVFAIEAVDSQTIRIIDEEKKSVHAKVNLDFLSSGEIKDLIE